MCGLFSIFPKAGADELSLRILALFLGIANVRRGSHSFGVWGKGVEPMRKTGALNDKDNIADFRRFVFESWHPTEGQWFAGHTRQATHGARTVENTHPFSVGNLTLAHNGVVSVDGFTDKDHDVDSGRIALSIVKHGWCDGLAKVSGSCALVANVDDHLLLYRHNQVLHIVSEAWGWAVSSEKNALVESCLMAGLTLTDQPIETPLDSVYAPWDGVLQSAPAKAYEAPKYQPCNYNSTYRAGHYDDTLRRWVYDDEAEEFDTMCGIDYFGEARKGAHPMPLVTKDNRPLVSDAKAKQQHLGHKSSTTGRSQFQSEFVIERATRTLLELKGLNKTGPVKLTKESRVRAKLIEWAIEVRRFDTHVDDIRHMWDKDTNLTTQTIIMLGVAAPWYRNQTEEVKEKLWIDFYAKVLDNVGVTPEEFEDAAEEINICEITDANGLPIYKSCDWCGELRAVERMKSCNFGGTNQIEVCDACMTDFTDQRRDLDWRDNRAAKKNGSVTRKARSKR